MTRTQRSLALLALTGLLAGLLSNLPAAAAGFLFSDGFESGNLAPWTSSSGMVVQQQLVSSGSWAARATSTGGSAYVYKTLSAGQPDLYYDGRFDVVSQANNNVSLVRFRTATAGPIFTVYRRADGLLYYYNEVTGTTAVGGTVSTGSWHELLVHAVVNGTAGQIQVTLDGAPVATMTKTDNLGTTPTGRVYVGEPATGRTFDIAYDAQVLSTSADVTSPSSPTGLQATANGANEVNLSWGAATDNVGVAGYGVYRDGTLLSTVPSGSTTYKDTAVLPSTAYAYTVDAVDAAGNRSARSATASATTTSLDVTAPSTPTGLTAQAVSATRVDLTWNASTDNVAVTGYSVYRNGTVLATVSGSTTSYSDTSASPSTTYTYAVDAVDAGGNHSSASTSQQVTTPAPPDMTPPTVPTGLAVTGAASNSVGLSWSAASDNVAVTTYRLYRDGAFLSTVDGSTTSWTDTTVAPQTTYSYSVDAGDAAGNRSAPSSAVTVTTPAAADNVPPAAPTNATATAESAGDVRIGWTASTDNVAVAGYTLYRDGTALTTTGSSTTSFDDLTVSPATTYRYAVDAFDAAGNHSPQSVQVTATTPTATDTTSPTVPGGLTAAAVGSNRIDVAWQPSSDNVGVTGYVVYRNASVVTTVAAPATSYSDTGLVPSTSYTYTVAAVDAAGNTSARSALVTASTAAAPDTTAPTVPTAASAQAISPTRVDLTWNGSTDNVGVSGYTVYRGGVVVANVGAGFTAFSDNSVTHATTYTYTVDAFDAAGNHSAGSNATSVTTPGLAFADGFESGNVVAWTGGSGMTVQRSIRHSGTFAARGSSTGAATYVYKSFSPAMADFFYDGWVQVLSQSSTATVSLVRFRTSTLGGVFSVMRRGDGRLNYYNEVTKISTTLAAVSTGTWHRLVVHATINGTAGGVALSLDGTTLLNKVDNLGVTPVGRVYVGDVASGNTYDMAFDDISLSTSSDTSPPSTPAATAANSVGPRHVNVTWSPSTDNVAVTAYTVARDGVVVGSVGPLVNGFADFAASPSTSPSYTVVAIDTSGNASTASAAVSATTPAGAPSDPVVITTGDTACDPTVAAFHDGAGTATACHQRYTSDLAWNSNPTAVLPLGDEQYEVGSLAAFQQSYDPAWGRMASISHPVPGNHEYLTAGGSGYYSYFGAAAGPASKGYYSYDLGSWHVVALNGECAGVGGCGPGSVQDEWLRADLAAHPSSCTLAYWHEPRWSSGSDHGSDPTYSQFWNDLYAARADIVLNGHDHDYERFAVQDALGQADPSAGIRAFVVGTGGEDLRPPGALENNSQVYQASTFGALQLSLHAGSYDWQFLNDGGSTFTDSGSESCR